HQHRMFDHIGEIAGVKGVAIIHGAKLWAQSHARKFTAVKVVKQPPRASGDFQAPTLEYGFPTISAFTRADDARSALTRERRASAAHRRHDELFAAAGARVDVGAGAEAQVLAEANAHLAQAPAAAGHRDAVAGEAGICLHEGLLDLIGRDRERRA